MPRRSKEDALATRHALLDAAERVFQRKGVSATSLADIALEAGTTRGAIYWHFADKADLYNAMIERVSLPLEHALQDAAADRDADPLPHLHRALMNVLDMAAGDARTRRVFEVATHKVEYVEALAAVRQRHITVRDACLQHMRRVLQRSATHRGVRLALPADRAARGLHALVDGLLHNWMLDGGAFDLRRTGKAAIDAYLRGLDLGPVRVTASAPR